METSGPSSGISSTEDVLSRIDENLALHTSGTPQTGVVVLSVNDFRHINIAYGYEFGERLMVAVLQRLQEGLPKRDAVFRHGSSDFVIILTALLSAENLMLALEKIKVLLFPPFSAGRARLRLKTTIGATVSARREGLNGQTLLQEADQALLDARFRYQERLIHDVSQPLESSNDLAIQMHLEYALERNELHLEYQPKVDLRTRRVVGVEALSRWVNPTLGFVPPDKFIISAEKSGMISKLTEWAIKTAVKQYQDWGDHAVPIAVNLSPGVLGNPHLVDLISSPMSIWNMPKDALSLEVTETAVMENPDDCLTSLKKLSDFGLSLSVDDFGTGYSSLAYLKRLPVKELKIDKSFVDHILTDRGDQKIVDAVVNLARSLGLKTVVEGIEHEEQFNLLAKMGCTVAQGYYISRPMKAEDFTGWIDTSEGGWYI